MAAHIQSIQRATAVLQVLAGARRQMGVVELAGELELSKTTVSGILRTLRTEGLVEQDPESRKYRLGPMLLIMGAAYHEGDELLARARRVADRLAAGVEHSVRVGAVYDARVVVLHHVRGAAERQHRSDVGSLMPLGSTALGRVLLSAHPDLLREWLSRSSCTTSEREQLLPEMHKVRARGWTSVEGDPFPWQDSIAAPIRDRRGHVVAAIAISGAGDGLLDHREGGPPGTLVYKLVDAAQAVSKELEGRDA